MRDYFTSIVEIGVGPKGQKVPKVKWSKRSKGKDQKIKRSKGYMVKRLKGQKVRRLKGQKQKRSKGKVKGSDSQSKGQKVPKVNRSKGPKD